MFRQGFMMAGSLVRFLTASGRKGMNSLLNQFNPPVVVLIYHRVTTLASDPHLLAVTPDNFRAHLRYLKDHFPIVRFESDWADIKEPTVVITFDDGYADNALEALPILEELEVPVTFFVSTGTIDTRNEFWWDELERIFLGEFEFPESFALEDSRFGKIWPTVSAADRLKLYQDIHPLMQRLDFSSREKWLQQIRRWAQAGEVGRETHRAMTVHELRRLAQSQWVTIGAHTVSHPVLSALPAAAQKKEISDSRNQLEALLKREVKVFSYPFGWKTDYNDDSIEICKESGFIKVAANVPGQAHRWSDPFQVPRHLVRNWPLDLFAEEMKTFWIA
jgi:peptidoglycan/xylan/chitin deacetylase (PgdA/CDA1 family)